MHAPHTHTHATRRDLRPRSRRAPAPRPAAWLTSALPLRAAHHQLIAEATMSDVRTVSFDVFKRVMLSGQAQ